MVTPGGKVNDKAQEDTCVIGNSVSLPVKTAITVHRTMSPLSDHKGRKGTPMSTLRNGEPNGDKPT